MIKRLKRRFLFVNISILTCVLLSILVSVFALMYSSEVKISYELMESLMHQKGTEHNETLSEVIIDEDVIDVTLMNNTYDDNYDGGHFEDNRDYNNKPFPTDNVYEPPYNNDMPKDDNEFFPPHPIFTEPMIPSETMQTTAATTIITKTTETKINTEHSNKNTDLINKKPDEQNKPENPTDKKIPQTDPPEESSEETTVTKPEFKYESSDTTKPSVDIPQPDKKPPMDDFPEKNPPDPFEGKVKRSYVYVEFNDINEMENAVYQYLATENDTEIKEAVNQIYTDNDERGKITIGGNKYRYMYRFNPVDSSYSIVMLDRTLEINTINRMLFIFIIIAGAGLILIFFISLLLANWTIKPVEKAWTQQKEFIANASHELKTPLTVISTNTDVVLSYPDDTIESQAKWLNYIKNETVRMSKLVNNLLCIAKYDAKRIETAQDNMDLSKTVSSVCLQYEPLAFENSKTLITDIDDDIKILGDEDKIKQVVNILMDNALKYSLPNGTIKVSLKKIKQSSVCMTVSNSSEDISQEHLDKIFDRFYRVDSSRNRKTGGSGLGLNIAKTIVENHNGTINVINKDGITSFVVTF